MRMVTMTMAMMPVTQMVVMVHTLPMKNNSLLRGLLHHC